MFFLHYSYTIHYHTLYHTLFILFHSFLQACFFYAIHTLLNTYWTKPSPLLKNSMLPRAILGDGEAGAQYCPWKHTIFDNGRGCVQISVLVLPLLFSLSFHSLFIKDADLNQWTQTSIIGRRPQAQLKFFW